MRILIADPDEGSRRSLERDVTAWGYEALIARDGKEAAHLLRQQDGPGVALLHVGLPRLTGVDVCRRVRRGPDAPFVYLILLAAAGEEHDAAAALEAGADDYVCLPYRESELRARIGVGVRLVEQYETLARQSAATEERLQHLRESEKQLRHLAYADRLASLGVMATALAHDLSQPLAAILTNAQAALRLPDNAWPDLKEVREILDDIVEDSHRAREVLAGLRDLAVQDAPCHTRLSVNPLVHGMLRLAHGQAIYNQVSVVMDLADDVPPIVGDATQIQQVILNLLTNAMDALRDVPAEQRVVIVSTAVGEGGSARICVRDRGPGIPADRLATVLEPFRPTNGGRPGIGLTVSGAIVTWHGGRIWAENHPDGGAQFCVELPAAE